MATKYDPQYLESLVQELIKLPKETEWLEFKVSQADAEEIGEYISALSNSAALQGKSFAYLLWGIDDLTHSLVGTTFVPSNFKVGNEELESWLLRLLSPKLQFEFFTVTVDQKPVVILEIERAYHAPTQFKQAEYIRIGSYKKRLSQFADRERALWRVFDQRPFEVGIALERQSEEKVTQLLDFTSCFDLLKRPPPENRRGVIAALASEKMITPSDAGGWNITNLGGLLFAKSLDTFPTLRRKAMRVIQYRGIDRVHTIKEQVGSRGYASGFEGLINYVNGLIPTNEVIGKALRKDLPMFPELAVRELVANALIHQDLFVGGAGPMVEIFQDRIEITNPGAPLVDTARFLDSPPQSRNEALASLLRRFGVCEERGSGWDKVVHESEYYQLPAPLAERTDGHTRVTLFAYKPLSAMTKAERIHACYLHSCLKYVMRQFLTNPSLRERLGVEEHNKATVSRYIKEAVEAGLIAPDDESAARNQMRYVPFWAKSP